MVRLLDPTLINKVNVPTVLCTRGPDKIEHHMQLSDKTISSGINRSVVVQPFHLFNCVPIDKIWASRELMAFEQSLFFAMVSRSVYYSTRSTACIQLNLRWLYGTNNIYGNDQWTSLGWRRHNFQMYFAGLLVCDQQNPRNHSFKNGSSMIKCLNQWHSCRHELSGTLCIYTHVYNCYLLAFWVLNCDLYYFWLGCDRVRLRKTSDRISYLQAKYQSFVGGIDQLLSG